MPDQPSSQPTWPDIYQEVLAARSAEDVLAAVARAKWHQQHDLDKPCPPETLPSPADLAQWLPECPRDVWIAIAELLEAWEQPDLESPQDSRAAPLSARVSRSIAGGHWDLEVDRGHHLPPWLDVAKLHAEWRAIAASTRGKHPLGPLIRAWQQRPTPVDPDRRQNGILPQPLASVRGVRVVERSSEQDNLPDTTGVLKAPGPEQAWLPGMEPPPSKLVPALPLLAFDLGGGISLAKGRGAPVALRLFTEALLMVPRGGRGGAVRIEKPARELIAELWPNRRPMWGGKQGRGAALRKALYSVHTAMVPYDGDYWIPVVVRRLPSGLDGTVILDVEMPGGSDKGPLVHKPTLRLQGVRSAPAYRAYLGLCALRNRYATHKGRILPPRVPEVLRDRSGALVDVRGRIVTGPGRIPVKHWNDPRAVRTGRFLPNEEMWKRLPWLDNWDLIALCYPDVPQAPVSTRKALQRSKATIQVLESDGLVLVRRERPSAPKGREGRWKIALSDHPQMG